ncbi:MAG TPA: ABC transporter permease [Lachnospiraceae bacterium]|nr:ABC transporter permease [Lachnospiraceae bacterium]HCR41689.1 ABC transporter permease [Lachnospiraceae bacterium]
MASYAKTKMNPKGFHKQQIKYYIILFPVVLFMLLPIVYIVTTAFKPIDELFLFPPRFLVKNPTLSNFTKLFEAGTGEIPVSRYVFNSLLVTAAVLFFSIVFSSMAGFALSKMKFTGKKFWFEVNQLALMFVPASVAIPKYLVVEKLGLIDTIWAHIFTLLAMPVGLFLVKQFIDQIPDALIEAAYIDGANDFTIYRKIVLPMIKPALATVAILSFQTVWNGTETSSIYINNEELKTLAFYLNTLNATTGNTIAGQGIAAAASLIMFVPNIIIFIFFQSKVMDTVAYSGIK